MPPRLPAAPRLATPRAPPTRLPLLRHTPPSPSGSSPPPAQRAFSPLLPQHHAPPPPYHSHSHSIRRTISTSWLLSALPNLPNPTPLPPPKTLRARRTLPYPTWQVYALIADIDSYSSFLPHCTHSAVTSWVTPPTPPTPRITAASPPSPPPNRHPAIADLTVGWGPFTQTYTSRVYCVPGSVVEAVSGAAATSIPREVLRREGYRFPEGEGEEGQAQSMEGGIFQSLVTRWTVAPVFADGGSRPASKAGKDGEMMQKEWTEVTLSVTFQFANPALGFAVGKVADDKVDEMVAAFEERARKLYGRR
ncbi:hypothetical protein N656DRAFT_750909 [Canariomyces notabilis]|uniref:Coenzyme Q-binding protein COQ10 START domain-containing protein n=1 Tax=Canariomyces notabilis TaxID=2074819 RepID=A0AAN6TG58_9PEZI|nr:hypothetical protein N656DRAFT_750909 [Canariomyces arenarius]